MAYKIQVIYHLLVQSQYGICTIIVWFLGIWSSRQVTVHSSRAPALRPRVFYRPLASLKGSELWAPMLKLVYNDAVRVLSQFRMRGPY